MTWGRFHLLHDDAGRYADIYDDQGVCVGCACEGPCRGDPPKLYLNGEALGGVSAEDLAALQALLRERTVDRDYGS